MAHPLNCLATIGRMTVPERDQAAAVLLSLHPAPRLRRHMTAIAEIAAFLAARLEKRGVSVDRTLVESSGLLHDLDKALPRTDPLRKLGHGYAGAKWLTDHGYAELGPPVAWHPVSRLGDDTEYERFLADATWEVRLVAYADKRAAQRLGPIGDRFQRWKRRHPELAAELKQARKRAALLEEEVCKAAGIAPEDVRRLRWVGTAMKRAHSPRKAA